MSPGALRVRALVRVGGGGAAASVAKPAHPHRRARHGATWSLQGGGGSTGVWRGPEGACQATMLNSMGIDQATREPGAHRESALGHRVI